MTMHIYFNQDKDGFKANWSGYVERTLARRFCKNGIAVPYQKHLDNLYDAKQAKISEKKLVKVEIEEKADAEKEPKKEKEEKHAKNKRPEMVKTPLPASQVLKKK